MTQQEKLDQIQCRLQKPENASRLEQAKNELGIGIWWHYNRASNSLKIIASANKWERLLYELDFSVSVRKVERMMNEQGWL